MVRFDPEYPFKSPAVQFVVSDKVKPPIHPVRSSPAFSYIRPKLTVSRIQSMSIQMATYVLLLILVFTSRIDFSQICASILGDDWSPTLSVMAICITIQSMLASCKVCLVLETLLLGHGVFSVLTEERIVSPAYPPDLSPDTNGSQARR
jgi:ubiquitin-conjugating enzyme E2 W